MMHQLLYRSDVLARVNIAAAPQTQSCSLTMNRCADGLRSDNDGRNVITTFKYDYDVAISFGYMDEPFANKLHSLLEGRLKLFLYSKEQEKLAGADGEATFNEVFCKTAKLVVILYREARSIRACANACHGANQSKTINRSAERF